MSEQEIQEIGEENWRMYISSGSKELVSLAVDDALTTELKEEFEEVIEKLKAFRITEEAIREQFVSLSIRIWPLLILYL